MHIQLIITGLNDENAGKITLKLFTRTKIKFILYRDN